MPKSTYTLIYWTRIVNPVIGYKILRLVYVSGGEKERTLFGMCLSSPTNDDVCMYRLNKQND